MHSLAGYLNYIFTAINKHKIHSPFVFNLITNVFEDKTKYSEYDEIIKYQYTLNSSTRLLEICDLGARSRDKKFITYTDNIQTINKRRKLNNSKLFFLYRLVKHLEPSSILELGTSFGGSTTAMHLANKSSIIQTVEGCANIADVANEHFKKFNYNNIVIHNGSFDSEVPEILKKQKRFDLIFIDGNHRGSANLKYFDWFLNHTNENSCILYDDINWSKDMTSFWDQICKHPKVSVSINLFHFGLIFFKKGLQKQNYTIKGNF